VTSAGYFNAAFIYRQENCNKCRKSCALHAHNARAIKCNYSLLKEPALESSIRLEHSPLLAARAAHAAAGKASERAGTYIAGNQK